MVGSVQPNAARPACGFVVAAVSSRKGIQDDERNHAENDNGERDHFGDGKRLWVIFHARIVRGNCAGSLIYVQWSNLKHRELPVIAVLRIDRPQPLGLVRTHCARHVVAISGFASSPWPGASLAWATSHARLYGASVEAIGSSDHRACTRAACAKSKRPIPSRAINTPSRAVSVGLLAETLFRLVGLLVLLGTPEGPIYSLCVRLRTGQWPL